MSRNDTGPPPARRGIDGALRGALLAAILGVMGGSALMFLPQIDHLPLPEISAIVLTPVGLLMGWFGLIR